MSADELRRAAETLRERADDATSATGPASMQAAWTSEHNRYDGETTVTSGEFHVGQTYSIQAGDYIATMDPSVGLALADWLDTAGADLWAYGPLCECGSGCHECDDSLWEPHVRRALAIARLINGGAS